MTTIRFYRDQANGLLKGFQAKGHSGFAAQGEDIVCAGISALTQTALLGIEQLAGLQSFYHISKANVECILPDVSSADSRKIAEIILETTRLGLMELAEAYPDFLQVIDEEV
jgi:uncharacterized protein YsxB (DUF464 family)